MTKLPETKKLKIETLLEDEVITLKYERAYLGISGIGKSCPRAIWYNFRFASKKTITPRIERIFNFGHRTEPYIMADLLANGMKVHSEQREVIEGDGHIKGHIDGIVEKVPDAPETPHLLEIKTMADKYFKTLSKSNVKKNNPVYYIQVQCYMYLLKLTRCLFIVENKNTSARYYERIKLDKDVALKALRHGVDIINIKIPPERIGSSIFWQCKFCDHRKVCHEKEPVNKNCRTCHFSEPISDGRWNCNFPGVFIPNSVFTEPSRLSFQDQKNGCSSHKL